MLSLHPKSLKWVISAAARSVEFALQLCSVSKRQMPKIQGALTEQLSDAIAIAQNIPKTNQVLKMSITPLPILAPPTEQRPYLPQTWLGEIGGFAA